jgi:hypothetical protein
MSTTILAQKRAAAGLAAEVAPALVTDGAVDLGRKPLGETIRGPPVIEPLMVGVAEAARILGVGRNAIYGLFLTGHLRQIFHSGRRLVRVADLQRLCETSEPLPPDEREPIGAAITENANRPGHRPPTRKTPEELHARRVEAGKLGGRPKGKTKPARKPRKPAEVRP